MKKRIIAIPLICVAVILCLGIGYSCIPIEQKVLWKLRGEHKAIAYCAYRSDYKYKYEKLPKLREGLSVELKKGSYAVTEPYNDLFMRDCTPVGFLTSTYEIIDCKVITADAEYLSNTSNVAVDFINSIGIAFEIESCYIIEISKYGYRNRIETEYLIQLNDKTYAIIGQLIVELAG